MRALAAALAVLLAGCSGGGGAGDDADPDASLTQTGTGQAGQGARQVVPPRDVPVDWDGNLVSGVWWCEGVVFGDCRAAPDDAFGADFLVEGLAGNATGNLTLAWDSANAITEQLIFEAFVETPGCDDCPGTDVPGAVGTSPLTVRLDAVPVPADAVLHLVVYTNKYAGHQLATGGVSGQQDFQVEGTLRVAP